MLFIVSQKNHLLLQKRALERLLWKVGTTQDKNVYSPLFCQVCLQKRPMPNTYNKRIGKTALPPFLIKMQFCRLINSDVQDWWATEKGRLENTMKRKPLKSTFEQMKNKKNNLIKFSEDMWTTRDHQCDEKSHRLLGRPGWVSQKHKQTGPTVLFVTCSSLHKRV